MPTVESMPVRPADRHHNLRATVASCAPRDGVRSAGARACAQITGLDKRATGDIGRRREQRRLGTPIGILQEITFGVVLFTLLVQGATTEVEIAMDRHGLLGAGLGPLIAPRRVR